MQGIDWSMAGGGINQKPPSSELAQLLSALGEMGRQLEEMSMQLHALDLKVESMLSASEPPTSHAGLDNCICDFHYFGTHGHGCPLFGAP